MNRPLPPAKIVYKDQVVLRPVEPTDIPQVEEALKCSLAELQTYMHWSHYPLTREKFLERVLHQHACYFKGSEYELGAFSSEGNFLLFTGFYPVSRINPLCFEIGYWTNTKFAGKGWATLATQIQIALLFSYFKSDRIEITANLENHASLRIIEKCGFVKEGALRNYYPKGNEAMYAKGYTKERTVSLFSLTPQDIPNLPWYQEVLSGITLHPLLGDPYPLRNLAGKD